MKFLRWSIAPLVATTLAAQAPAPRPGFDKKTFEAYVRQLLLYPPQITIAVADPKPSEVPSLLEVRVRASDGTASEERLYLVSSDGSKILDARVYDLRTHPFLKDAQRISTAAQPSLGTPGAPVTIVLFTDYQCPYCKKEADAIRQDLLKVFPTQVQLFLKDLPLEQIHPWARPAAIAGRCVFRAKPAAFWDYHDWIFARQGEMTLEKFPAEFAAWAQSKKLEAPALDACRSGPDAAADVTASLNEARALGVTSTPTLFINGRKLGGFLEWPSLKQIIELELQFQKTLAPQP